MPLTKIIENLRPERILEIYNQARISAPAIPRRDFGHIDWRGYEALKSFLPLPSPIDGEIEFTPDLIPASALNCAYDLVILNDVLGYSENILLTLKNAITLLRPGGHLLLACDDKRYSRGCRRQGSGLAKALEVYLNGVDVGDLAFDAVYNASLAYDLPSFWHSGNVVERDGLSYQESLQVRKDVAAGRKYYLPYWVFSEKSFLFFLGELTAMEFWPFSLESLIQVKEYERQFYVLLRDHSDDAAYAKTLKSRLAHIDEMIRLLEPNQIKLRGDGEDALRFQVDMWQKEFYKLKNAQTKKKENEKGFNFKLGRLRISLDGPK